MRFPLPKLLPLLLPLLQLVSGTSLTELSTTLPSLRLVGSFSIGIEGTSTPLSFSHTLNLPLVPVSAQRLLHHSNPRGAIPSPAPEPNPEGGIIGGPSDADRVLAVRRSFKHGLKTPEDRGHEGCAEEIPDIDPSSQGDGGELVLRRPDAEDEEKDESWLCEKGRVVRKRKADNKDAEELKEPREKRLKIEENIVVDKAERKSSKKHGKGREGRKRKRKCCEHCERGL